LKYRGGTFCGVDEDAIHVSTEAQPLDTWLQNRLQGNVQMMARGLRMSNYSSRNGNLGTSGSTGDRPWAIYTDWHSVLLTDIPVSHGLRAVEVTLAVRTANGNGTSGAVNVEVRLDRRFIRRQAITTTGAWQAHTITVELPEPITQASLSPYSLEVYVQSEDVGERTGATDGVVDGSVLEVDTSTFFAETSAGSPNSTSIDTQTVSYSTGSVFAASTDGEFFDPVHRGNGGISIQPGAPDDACVRWPNAAQYQQGSFRRRYISYAQLRSISVRPVYTLTSVTTAPQEALRARRPATAASITRTALGARELYMRPRALSQSPSLFTDPDSEGDYAARGYAPRWPFVDGDQTGGETLIDTVIWPTSKNPVLAINLKFICVANGQLLQSRRVADEDNLGLFAWDLQTLILQPEDSASTWAWNANTDALVNDVETVQLTAYPLARETPYLATRTMRYVISDNTAIGTRYLWAWKEGALTPLDQELVQEVQIIHRIDYDETNNAYPLRLVLAGALDSVITDITGSLGTDRSRRLTLVGYSVIEYPVDNPDEGSL
jgi:hypothetical protein